MTQSAKHFLQLLKIASGKLYKKHHASHYQAFKSQLLNLSSLKFLLWKFAFAFYLYILFILLTIRERVFNLKPPSPTCLSYLIFLFILTSSLYLKVLLKIQLKQIKVLPKYNLYIKKIFNMQLTKKKSNLNYNYYLLNV